MQNKLIYISYYTKNTIYEEATKDKLIPSLEKFNLPYHIYPVDDLGKWERNRCIRASILFDALNTFKEDIVWTDADSIINSYPTLLYEIPLNIDIAICNLSWEEMFGRPQDKGKFEIIAGTFLLRNTAKVKWFIKEWKEKTFDNADLNSVRPQRVLEEMLKQHHYDMNMYNLPRSYCYIVDTPWGAPPAVSIDNPHIVHYQLSRVARKRK